MLYGRSVLNAKSRQPKIGLQVGGRAADPKLAWILVLKALVLGQWASRSWLCRSLIAVVFVATRRFQVPTLGIVFNVPWSLRREF
jgi:hypothetical protein